MLPPYDDIMALTTRLLRELHWQYYADEHAEVHPECSTFSYDLTGKPDEVGSGYRSCACVPKVLWHDENGVPRFDAHGPRHFPIYADQIALVRISCQACEREFEVQMSWSLSGELADNVHASLRIAANGLPPGEPDKPPIPTKYLHGNPRNGLAPRIKDGTLHFGDPPYHRRENGGTCSGSTMNCWNLKVMEFWARGGALRTWVRVPKLEIELPDAADPERAP